MYSFSTAVSDVVELVRPLRGDDAHHVLHHAWIGVDKFEWTICGFTFFWRVLVVFAAGGAGPCPKPVRGDPK